MHNALFHEQNYERNVVPMFKYNLIIKHLEWSVTCKSKLDSGLPSQLMLHDQFIQHTGHVIYFEIWPLVGCKSWTLNHPLHTLALACFLYNRPGQFSDLTQFVSKPLMILILINVSPWLHFLLIGMYPDGITHTHCDQKSFIFSFFKQKYPHLVVM